MQRNTADKQKGFPLWLIILIDILMVGVVLVIFAFFHHVLPTLQAQLAYEQEDALVDTEPSVVPTETTEADNRTPWQIKFQDHFTDEVVVTENSYTSPEVSISIEKIVTGKGNDKLTYYVADVYVSSLDNFKTYTPRGEMVYFDTQSAEKMVSDSNAILAISGDFLTYQKSGFLVRNGEPYVTNRNFNSICVLYPDGVMETYMPGKYKVDEILAKNPVHVWSFGPPLLDKNGSVMSSYAVSAAVSYRNPRCGIGYFEPGHYLFVTVDGRQNGHSKGMLIKELAKVFEDYGCKTAYNLDGGGTAVMLFDGERISKQSNGKRNLGDIILITEVGYTVPEKKD